MKARRRAYSEKFKAEVVRLVREDGLSESAVARERELAESTVRRWIRKAVEEGSQAEARGEEADAPATSERCEHRAYLAALRRLHEAADGEIEEAAVFEQIEGALEAVMKVAHARDASVLARDEGTGDMYFVVSRGVLPPEDLLWKRVPPGHGIVQWVAEHRRSVTINDVTHDPRFYAEMDAETGFRTRNLIATPLERDDRVLGVIELLNKTEGALFTVEDLGNLRLMAAHLATLLARLG